jgi:hypothetical protein
MDLSSKLLQVIEEKVTFAHQASAAALKHQAELDSKVEDAKKTLRAAMDGRSQVWRRLSVFCLPNSLLHCSATHQSAY